MEHSFYLFNNGILEKIRNPILKCPICKKKEKFQVVDFNCNEGHGYVEGDYARAYRCIKCHIVIVKQEKELTQKIKDDTAKQVVGIGDEE
jgi:hypothetical protein